MTTLLIVMLNVGLAIIATLSLSKAYNRVLKSNDKKTAQLQVIQDSLLIFGTFVLYVIGLIFKMGSISEGAWGIYIALSLLIFYRENFDSRFVPSKNPSYESFSDSNPPQSLSYKR